MDVEETCTAIPPLMSGFDGLPWPELVRGGPALVVPQAPAYVRPVDDRDGWSAGDAEGLAEPHPDWSAVVRDQQVTITRPSGEVWFKGGPLLLTYEWRRAVGRRRAILLITGPFAHIGEFRDAAEMGTLCLIVVPLDLAGTSG